MAIRNIVQEGDPVLNKIARSVTSFDERLATLLDDMEDTLLESEGLGLAGPQVGVLRRVFVCLDERDVDEDDVNEIDEEYEPVFLEFVNPEIIAQEGEEINYEACLSFPGHNGAIKRPTKVTVRAFDRHGNAFTMDFEGLMARCACHECNHLDGITIMQIAEYFYEDKEKEE